MFASEADRTTSQTTTPAVSMCKWWLFLQYSQRSKKQWRTGHVKGRASGPFGSGMPLRLHVIVGGVHMTACVHAVWCLLPIMRDTALPMRETTDVPGVRQAVHCASQDRWSCLLRGCRTLCWLYQSTVAPITHTPHRWRCGSWVAYGWGLPDSCTPVSPLWLISKSKRE